MKEEYKLINIGNGKFILCLNEEMETDRKDRITEFMDNRFRETGIRNVCFLPFTIKEVDKEELLRLRTV